MPVNSFDDYPMSWRPRKEELEKPYYLSIAANLEKDILSGRLPVDTKLPPQRELADYLDLNLSTITRAYKLCELKGLLYAVTGKGTFVAPGISARDTFLGRSGVVIEMGMIHPFYESNEKVLDAARLVLNRRDSLRLLEYSDSLGTKRQINAARKWLCSLGMEVEEKNILLSAGAQNALSVILATLFKAGDKIAVDSFTYTNFKGLANFLHIQLVAVEMDEYGMSPAALAGICKNTEIKGVYLMPTCSNPTSIFMPQSRREELATIIREYHLLVIEDDIYSFLAAYGAFSPEVKSFFSMVPDQTIHICSVSKSLCAGLRVAFIAFADRYRELLVAGMLNINLKTVSLNGEIIAELIESGEARKIARQKIVSAAQRNRVFADVFPGYASHNIERFFHWLPLPQGLGGEEMEILALQQGIHILGSHRFAMHSDSRAAYVRVSVTSPDTPESLRTGLLILKSILEDKRMDFIV